MVPPTPLERFLVEVHAKVGPWKDDIDWLDLKAILIAEETPETTAIIEALLASKTPTTPVGVQ